MSPLCVGKAIAGVSPLVMARWESANLRATLLAQNRTPEWKPADTQPHAVTHSLTKARTRSAQHNTVVAAVLPFSSEMAR